MSSQSIAYHTEASCYEAGDKYLFNQTSLALLILSDVYSMQ